MKRSILCAVSIAAMCLTAPQAMAADFLTDVDLGDVATTSGLYASVFGGFTWTGTITGQYYGSSTIDLDGGLGFLAGVAVGGHITSDLRGEFELSATHSNIDDDDFMPQWNCNPGTCDARGSLSTVYMLGNIWWDIPMGTGFTPYIGGGVGAAWVNPDISLYEGNGEEPFVYSWDVGSLAPAAQLGAGVVYDISDNMAVDLGYRAKAVLGATFSDSEFPCGQGGSGACAAVDVMYVEHVIQAGLTFSY